MWRVSSVMVHVEADVVGRLPELDGHSARQRRRMFEPSRDADRRRDDFNT